MGESTTTIPEYALKVGRVGIRIPILGQAKFTRHLRDPSQHLHQTFSEALQMFGVVQYPKE